MADDMLNDAEFEQTLEGFNVESGWKFVARQQYALQRAIIASTKRRDAQCALESQRLDSLEAINRKALTFGGLGGAGGGILGVAVVIVLKYFGVNI